MARVLLVAYFASVILVPGSIFYRPDYVIAFLGALLGTFKMKAALFRIVGRQALILVLLNLFAIVSLMGQDLFGSSPLVAADGMIVFRYCFYVCALLFGVYAGRMDRNCTAIKLVLIVLIVFTVAISFIQYFNFLGLNLIIVPIYAEDAETLIYGDYWRRVVGTLGNPNYWGLFLAFGAVICGVKIFIENRFLWALPGSLLAVCLLYTGSRGAIVAMASSLIATMLLVAFYSKVRLRWGYISAATVTLLLLYSFYYFNFGHSVGIDESSDRFSLDKIDTLYMRIDYWGRILADVGAQGFQALIGQGPSKTDTIRSGDNIYILLLRDFGLIGALLYISLIVSMFSRLSRFSRCRVRKSRQLSIVGLSLIICLAVFDLAADAWFNVRIAAIILFLYGYLTQKSYLFVVRARNTDEGFNSHSKLERRRTRLSRSGVVGA